MNSYYRIKEQVSKMITEKRLEHSMQVEKEAVKLGKLFGVDIEKCRIAAIAHDCAKHFTNIELIEKAREYEIKIDDIQNSFPQLLHGPVGAMYCKNELQIKDLDIVNAIWYHTTGREDMSMLEKIIYLADVIEEGRSFPGIEKIRALSEIDIDKALILSSNSTLIYVIERNFLVHPLTIQFRNSLLLKGGK